MDESKNGSIWESLFSNFGGILTGAATVISSTKGNPVGPVPGTVVYQYGDPNNRNNGTNTLLIVGGLVLVVVLFLMLKPGK